MSRVCVHRCVQDPQQVVTRKRGLCATARWLLIRQGLCVPLCAPPPVVGTAILSVGLGKSALFSTHPILRPDDLFPLLSFFYFSPYLLLRESSICLLGFRWVFTTETMVSLIKISFCELTLSLLSAYLSFSFPFPNPEFFVFTTTTMTASSKSYSFVRKKSSLMKSEKNILIDSQKQNLQKIDRKNKFSKFYSTSKKDKPFYIAWYYWQ